MKLLLSLLLLAGCAYSQTPAKSIRRANPRRDSLPSIFPPDLMPNVRTSNSFYRHRLDPNNVMRATLDNMPVKVPDSSINYTLLRSYQKWRKPDEPPMRFLKPMPQIVPKRR